MTNAPVTYGFSATLTARPGRGDELVKLVLSALEPGNPAATDFCRVYLVSRSAAAPDTVQLLEGWTSEADHHRLADNDAARALIARFADLLDGEPVYSDLTPVGGKAML